jgi:hypothetical protein
MTTYVIRVDGSLSDELANTFPELVASVQSVSTVLQGDLPDQAALSGVLDELDQLGVQIIDFTSLPSPPPGRRETEPRAGVVRHRAADAVGEENRG